MIANLVSIVFEGLSYGILLFLMSVGLSVTMGIMRFLNMAHGASAILGGYVVVALVGQSGWPFLLALPAAFCAAAVFNGAFEVAVCRRLYAAGHLNQVLLTVGFVFMAVGAATYLWGAGQQTVIVPDYLAGSLVVGGIDIGAYRLFLLVVGGAITLLLVFGLERTRFGAQVRAAVDNRRMAVSLGINVQHVFTLTFALGGGLAGLGGALSIYMIGLDPSFPLKYLVFFLLVVSVGGMGSIGGTLSASLLLGLCDVAGKYYLPEIGAFIIYLVMVSLLLWRPAGLARRG